MRKPRPEITSVFESLTDVITVLSSMPNMEIKIVDIDAVASTEVEAVVRASFPVIGLVQINGTTSDIPSVEKNNTYEMKVTYDYDANTEGKQQYTYLLIGDNNG